MPVQKVAIVRDVRSRKRGGRSGFEFGICELCKTSIVFGVETSKVGTPDINPGVTWIWGVGFRNPIFLLLINGDVTTTT